MLYVLTVVSIWSRKGQWMPGIKRFGSGVWMRSLPRLFFVGWAVVIHGIYTGQRPCLMGLCGRRARHNSLKNKNYGKRKNSNGF